MMGSARLPPGWPGFDSCLEFVAGFCFAPRVFFSGFSSLHKINNSTRIENPRWCGFLSKYYLFIYFIYHCIKLPSYNSVYLAYDVKYISWKFDVKIRCKYYTVGILHDVKKTFVGIRYEWRRSLPRNWFSAIYTIVVYLFRAVLYK